MESFNSGGRACVYGIEGTSLIPTGNHFTAIVCYIQIQTETGAALNFGLGSKLGQNPSMGRLDPEYHFGPIS